jgi:hypothetical protein
METSAEVPAGPPAMATGNGKGKVRLLTRQSLDGRTKARKQFDAVVTGMPIPMKIKVIPVLRMTNWKRKPLPSARPPPALD